METGFEESEEYQGPIFDKWSCELSEKFYDDLQLVVIFRFFPPSARLITTSEHDMATATLVSSIYSLSNSQTSSKDIEDQLETISTDELGIIVRELHNEGRLEDQAVQLLCRVRSGDLTLALDARSWKMNNTSLQRLPFLQSIVSLNLAGVKTFESVSVRFLNGEAGWIFL
jgi:hypothetical protein